MSFFSHRTLMLSLLLIVWGVAVWGANADAIWIDEWWTTHYIGAAPNNALNGPIEVIERLNANRIHENNPVGYYVLMHLWYRMVGQSDVALRIFSGLCTMVSVTLMYQLGRAVASMPMLVSAAKEKRRIWSTPRGQPVDSKMVGFIAAVILGLSAFFLNYGHELRMYALAGVWGVSGLLAYWRFTHARQTAWGWGILLMVSGAGLLYTHYSNALLIVLLGLFHLFVTPKDRRWWQTVGLAGGSVLLFSPHLIITLSIFDRFVEKVTTEDVIPAGIWSLLDVLRMTVMGFINEQPVLLIIILLALIVTLCTPLTQSQRKGLLFSGMLSAGGVLLLLVLLKAFQTLFHVRYMLVVWIPLALFSALVLSISVQRFPKTTQNALLGVFLTLWAGAGLLLSLNISYHGLTYSHPEFHNTLTEPTRWDLLGDTLEHEAHPGDAVVVSVGGDVPWTHTGNAEYYVYGKADRLLMLDTRKTDPETFPGFIHGAGRVWLARNAAEDVTEDYQAMEETLSSEGYAMCGDMREVGGVALTTYSIAPQCCYPPETVIAKFGDAATLFYTNVISQEGSIAVWQGWNVTAANHADYSVGVYAFDKAGNVVGQRDMTLPAAGYSCLLSEFDAPDTEVTLRMTVYEWATGARLPVSEASADQLLTIPTR
jgi:hypothetical protein